MPTRKSWTTPILLVLAAILSLQLGAAFAKNLFGQVTPTTMTWLRQAASALVLLALARPRLTGRSAKGWLALAAYAVSLILMNWVFYLAVERIPLGLGVTIEFIGPLVLAAALSRGVREIAMVGLAAVGVVLLGAAPTTIDWIGVGLAAFAGVLWAVYILVTPIMGSHWSGRDGLTLTSVFGAIGLAPVVAIEGGFGDITWSVVGVGLAVGLLSSVIPYSLELQALRTLPRRVFSVLMALEPAAAAGAAMLVLGEMLSWVEWVAMACVIVASVGVTRSEVKKGVGTPPPEVAV